jgi:TonB family protein
VVFDVRRLRGPRALPIAGSVLVHAALAGWLSWVALRTVEREKQEASAIAAQASVAAVADDTFEAPTVADGLIVQESSADPVGDVPRVTAGDAIARLDANGAGHGGDAATRERALNLADRDERARLSPDSLSRLDRDQLQRLRVARVRLSWEDRRSTLHPAELTLIANGPGSVRERRPTSSSDPSRGALESPLANARGSLLGSPAPTSEGLDAFRAVGGETRGSFDGSPGLGLLDGRPGVDHRASAPVGSARPAVMLGPVSIPSTLRGSPKDDVDSEQEVATQVRSLVHASTAGGVVGAGEGGTGGGGAAGAGGATGAGSRALPLGLGEGNVYDYWTSDPRLVSYFRSIHAKIDPLWANAFPRSALLELKQGTVIIEFTVMADGRAEVAWPPLRASGVDEFDRNCADAIRRAAPFPPIPAELGLTSVRIRAPFAADNPIVK